jgi:PAS domain S-box-containing protein
MAESVELAASRLGAIVESSDDAIVSKDLNGIVLTWNRAAERMFGYTAAEIIGKSITTIIPPDRLGEETEVLSRISRGQSVDHYETLRRRKDGTLIPISLTVSPLRSSDGTVVGASKIARDISDRRRAEEALARLAEQQRDLHERLIALVARAGTMFGTPRLGDVLSGALELGQTLVPADAHAIWRFDPAASVWRVGAASGLSAAFTERIISSSGGKVLDTVPFSEPLVAERIEATPLLKNRLPLYEAEGIRSMLAVPLQIGGQASGTLVFYFREVHAFDDVEVQTARALANLAAAAITTADLYESQRRMREQAERASRQAEFLSQASAALVSSLDYEATLQTVAHLAVPHVADWCAVDIVDDRGEIARVAVAHVKPEKVELARTLQERFPEVPNRPGPVTTTIRTGKPSMMSDVPPSLLQKIARGPEHLAALRALSITSYICVPLVAHGRTLGAMLFVSAESGRRYTEADLQFAQDVAYRSAIAVDNARAYARANAANRAKDEFLAMLSHELRTPLNAVLGWIRMLRSGSVAPAKVPRALEVIEHNASAQLRLVEDLLDLSRIITGKFRLDVTPVHVMTAVDGAVSAIQPAATAKNITVQVDVDADAPVLGDRHRLQQAVWNLLSNAIKFTPSGGRVAVGLHQDDSHVILDVRDTGEGIAADVLPHVFDRFHQGEAGSTRSHAGLGLGLAIVRHIVEMHGGRVWARSEGKGRGATFTIALPRLHGTPAGPDGRGAAATPAPASVPPHLTRAVAGLRVLVVDDDDDARELLRELLDQHRIGVRLAGSVDEAIAELDREIPDAVVSDIAMAGQDGYDLIRKVRQRPAAAGAAVPAVALSAYARAEDVERSLASGFAAHLPKPVELPDLLNAIAEATGRI